MKKQVLTFAMVLCAIITKAQLSIDTDPGNDTFFGADLIPLNSSYVATDTAQLISNSDGDWFKIRINRGGVLIANLQPNPLGTPIRLSISSYDSLVYVASQNNMGSAQANSVGFPLANALENQVCAGVYYFKIAHVSGTTGTGSYIFNIYLDTLECECNDVKAQACLVPVDTCFDARLQGSHANDPGFSGKDFDWYQIHLLSHDSIKVAITHAPANQRFIIEGYSSLSSNYILKKTASGNGSDVTWGCLGLDSGIWQFRVYEYSAGAPAPDPYTISDSIYHICFSRCGNVGIDEHTNNTNFSIYPNPSNSMLNVEMSEVKISSFLTIINPLGDMIYQTSLLGEKIKTINVSHLKEGIYFIKIQNKKESSIRKFIKQ